MNILWANPVWKCIVAIVVGIACCCFGLAPGLGAAVYRPEKGAMWDPSVLWHNGTYHAFMMYSQDGTNGLDAQHCLLATSADGVHWRTEGVVNQEREASAGNKFFKCFVRRCGDRFIMDHGVARASGQDVLRFYESTDLRKWDYLLSSSTGPALVRPAARPGPLGSHVYPAQGGGRPGGRLLGICRGRAQTGRSAGSRHDGVG